MANRTYFQLFMYTAAGIVCIVEVVDSARRVALILLTDVIDNLTAYNYKKDWLPKAGAIIHGAVIILYIFILYVPAQPLVKGGRLTAAPVCTSVTTGS